MILKIAIFFSLLVSVSIAQSGWTPAFEAVVSHLNEKDKRAFDNTLISCQSYRSRKITKFEFTPHEVNVFLGTAGDVNYAVDKSLESGLAAGSRVFTETRGIGMYLYELLNSYGFMLAMKKCFNGNETQEQLYVGELILIDAVVKGAYMGASYLSLKYLLARRWGLALITTLVVAPISGATPKAEELGMVERMEAELRKITEQVRAFSKDSAKR